MKFAITILSAVVFCWPIVIVGYIYAHIEAGFTYGKKLAKTHADETGDAIDDTTR